MNEKIEENEKHIIELREDRAKTRSEINAMMFMLKTILAKIKEMDNTNKKIRQYGKG